MAVIENFEDYLVNGSAQIDYYYLVIALILAALLAYILAKLYVRYGKSISNRKKFSSNFVLLTTTTTLIIMVVKSSLALSLGLVGALSIVRFRAAIKEPEELAFLFLCISIGLGLGAGQLTVTLLSFVIIGGLIYGRHLTSRKEEKQNLFLNVSGKVGLNDLTNILKKHCSAVHLKRFDHSDGDLLDTSFLVEFDSFQNMENLREELRKLSKSVKITYLDRSDIY